MTLLFEKRRILLMTVLIFALALSLGGCKKSPVLNVHDAYIPKTSTQQLNMAQIEKAIVEAGAGRGWVMSVVEPGQIIGTLNIRSHQARVLITYDEKTYNIDYKDSVNLKYDGQKIHQNYNRWIQYLERDINVRLSSILPAS